MEDYKPIFDAINEDENLMIQQKVWLKSYFALGPVAGRQRKVAAETGIAYSTASRWVLQNEHFQKWMKELDNWLVEDAEAKLTEIIRDERDLDAIKFVLTRLSPKYRDKIDVTSGGEKITAIQIGLIE